MAFTIDPPPPSNSCQALSRVSPGWARWGPHAGYAEYEHVLFEQPHGHPAAEAAGKPLHRGRIGRYVQDLTRAQIEEFEQIAESELSRLGYLSAPRLSGDA